MQTRLSRQDFYVLVHYFRQAIRQTTGKPLGTLGTLGSKVTASVSDRRTAKVLEQ